MDKIEVTWSFLEAIKQGKVSRVTELWKKQTNCSEEQWEWTLAQWARGRIDLIVEQE
jgi:lipoprotein NlpI